jgi:integrase
VEGLKKGRTSARETEPVKPVEDMVVEATLPHLPPVVADMVRFQRLTGCRPGEVCHLRPMDLDRSREVWAFQPTSHKTEHHGHQRVIFVGPKARAILLPYLVRPADAHCFSPAESVERRNIAMRARRKTKVQPSQVSRKKARPKRVPKDHYTRHSYRQAVARAIEKANNKAADEVAKKGIEPVVLKQWHPNQLRHTAGTEIRRQYGLEAAQVVLGHARADVTQVYAERDHALAADVMKKIG